MRALSARATSFPISNVPDSENTALTTTTTTLNAALVSCGRISPSRCRPLSLPLTQLLSALSSRSGAVSDRTRCHCRVRRRCEKSPSQIAHW